MVPHDVRLLPSSLRRVLLLGPVAVLALVLLAVFASSASATHPIDPPTNLTLSPGPYGTATSPSWTYSIPAGQTADCTLTGPNGPVSVFCGDNGASPAQPVMPLATDGSYTFRVTTTRTETTTTDTSTETPTVVIHPAGTSDAAVSSYLLDTAPPVLSVAGPQGAAYTGWSVGASSGGSAVTLTCTWAGPAPVPGSGTTCTEGPVKPELPQSGVYTLTVSGSDAAGNAADPVTSSFTYDADAPTVTFSTEPTGPSNNPSPQWAYSVVGGPAPSCTLNGPGAVATVVTCSPTGYTASLTSSGTYSLTVSSTDEAGNLGSRTSAAYLLDVTGPEVGITPAGATTGTAPGISWTVSIRDAAAATCELSNGTSLTCSDGSVISATLPKDATITLTVTAVDAVGNERIVTASYTRDTTPGTPSVTVDPVRSRNPDVTWSFSTGALTDSVQCRLDGPAGVGVLESCTSFVNGAGTYTTTLPADGLWTLHVFASNATSSASQSASATYDLDRAEPAGPALTQTPAASTGQTAQISWTWTVLDGHTTRCRLNVGVALGSWAACNGSFTTTATAQGDHTLDVQYVDDLLNEGTISSATYTYDTVQPSAPTVVGSRDNTTDNERAVSYVYSGDGTATCSLYRDGVLVTPDAAVCGPTGYSGTLPNSSGSYRLEVTFTDAAGNTSLPGASGTYVLDVTPPAVPPVRGSRDGQTDNERVVTYTYSGEGTATCFLYQDEVLVTPPIGTCRADGYTVTLPDVSGVYRAEVTFTDASGNTSAPGVSGDYVLDVTPPGLATVTVTPRTDNVESATWTVIPPEADTTTECRLLYQGGVVLDWHDCVAFTYPLDQGDGEYMLEVRVTDSVGNLGPVAVGQSYVVDMTPPLRPVVTSDRTGKDNERVVTYAFSGEGVATCQLTRGGVAVGDPVRGCTTGHTITLPDVSGVYVLVVTYEDAVGNVSGPGSSPAYELDVTPPTVPVVTSDRSGTDNERVVSYEFSGEGIATCQLTRDGAPVGAAVECTSPWVVTLPTTDGTYVLLVTYTDAVGNTSAAGASPAYVLDLTPPPAPVVLGPPPTGNTRTVTWTYSGEGSATCQLLLDGNAYGAETACGATSFSTTLPSDGAWSLSVAFTDAVGNRGPPGTSAGYLLDTVAPVAPGVVGPTGPAQSRSPSWTVTAETGSTVECRLLHAGSVIRDWSACSGSYGADLTGLPDGSYVVEARATDRAGNLGAVGSSVGYVLDSTAPLAPTVTGPSGPSQSRSPSFSWIGEPGTTAECLLSRDGGTVGGWTACSSGFAPTLDRDGTWTVTVRLTDVAGNLGAPAASGGYVLDTTPPPAPLVTPPQSPGRDLVPSWGAVVEGGTTLECRLTGPDGIVSGWAACTLPYGTPLEGRPDGAYVLKIRATDAAGNLGPVGSGRYVLDTVAPVAAVVTSPASPGRSRTPSFGFTSESGSTTRCRLTSGATLISDFAPCTSPALVDLTGLPDGTYTLTVRVFDAAGNPGPAATGTYVLDTTGPAAPVATLSPASPSADRTPTWAFSYEPGSTLLCRLTAPGGAVRDITACSSLTVDLTGQPVGTYTMTVRAVDTAGNVGAVLTVTYVLDPAAVSGPDVVGPVSPGSSRTPRWTISTVTTTECRLTLGTTVLREWTACAGSFTADLFGQPDGTYVLSVRTRTATGATSAATTSRYVLDTTAPAAATIVGPPTPSTNRQPTWSIASPELGATAECKVLLFSSVLRDWAACAVSPAGSLFADLDLDLDGRGDGTYTLIVRLTDAAGNRGPETSSAYVLDTSAPVGVGVTGPPSPGNDLTPTWTFSSPSSVQLECRLTSVDGVVSDWDACAGSYTADLTGLPSGTYTLAVRAVSAAGTPGPETTSAYVLSTEPPDGPSALALSGTNPTGNDRSPTWTFTLPTGTTGRCVVVQGARTVFDGACSSPFTLDLSNAQDGSYTLTVTAINAAGTESPGVSSTYVLDIVPPTAPVFTQVPGGPGSTLDPQWRFTVVYGATAECRLLYDGAPIGDWIACSSPYTAILTGRPDGRYVLEVRAIDAAGNSSPPRANAYVLDRTALPIVTFTRTPSTPGADRSAAWSLSAPQGSEVECRLVAPDGTTRWSDCAGGYRLDLAGRPDGDYVLEARVRVDGQAGSVARATYTLDTKPPDAPTFSSGPPAAGNDPQPRWSWDVTSDDLVECRLVRVDGGPRTAWEPCTSPYEARLSADGSYALEIRVVDAAGNLSPVTSRSYEYDTRAPAAPVMISRPPASGADRTVSWTFVVPQGTVATCTVTRGLSRVDERTCNGRYDLDLTDLPDGVYTLTVRLTDAAGNVSSPTTSRYTLASLGTGRPRVDPPPGSTGPPATGGSSLPPGTGRGGTGAGGTEVPQNSTSRPPLPNIPTDTDVPRAVDRPSTFPPRGAGQEAAAARPEPRETRARNPLIPDPLPVRDVPEVLREAVTSTITKPTLPLALLAIVILFLLAQNRIDRRDPKLASAPVEAEPELDFTTIVRRPGGAFS